MLLLGKAFPKFMYISICIYICIYIRDKSFAVHGERKSVNYER